MLFLVVCGADHVILWPDPDLVFPIKFRKERKKGYEMCSLESLAWSWCKTQRSILFSNKIPILMHALKMSLFTWPCSQSFRILWEVHHIGTRPVDRSVRIRPWVIPCWRSSWGGLARILGTMPSRPKTNWELFSIKYFSSSSLQLSWTLLGISRSYDAFISVFGVWLDGNGFAQQFFPEPGQWLGWKGLCRHAEMCSLVWCLQKIELNDCSIHWENWKWTGGWCKPITSGASTPARRICNVWSLRANHLETARCQKRIWIATPVFRGSTLCKRIISSTQRPIKSVAHYYL